MKALIWEAPRRLALREAAEPSVGPDEALLRVAYAGICGSELSGYLGNNTLRVPPLVMGHEFSGEVVALGEQARKANPALGAGRAVTVNPLVSCGRCAWCARGDNHLCPERALIGAHRPGAFAEYVSVPAVLATPLPDGMTLRTAALAEPAAVAARIAETAGSLDGEEALVLGAGPIGLLALQTLRLAGAARVLVADLSPERLMMSDQLGGERLDARSGEAGRLARDATGGRGVALAVDAVGTARTRAQCIAAVRRGGTVILTGLHEETSTMPVADVIREEIVLRGCFCYTPANFARAVEQLRSGAIRLDPWVVEAPLDEGGAWFERLLADPGNVSKVLLVPGHE